MLPLRSPGSDTVPFPLSGLSVSPFSLSLIACTGSRRSLFHSIAFMLRSRCASMINMYTKIFLPDDTAGRSVVNELIQLRPADQRPIAVDALFDSAAANSQVDDL